MREYLIKVYRRPVGAQGGMKWAARWWEYPEALSRLDALWRAWEHLRLDLATGMSVWWRDHADHHMPVLLSPSGPFAASNDQNKRGEPLPYELPSTACSPTCVGRTGEFANGSPIRIATASSRVLSHYAEDA